MWVCILCIYRDVYTSMHIHMYVILYIYIYTYIYNVMCVYIYTQIDRCTHFLSVRITVSFLLPQGSLKHSLAASTPFTLPHALPSPRPAGEGLAVAPHAVGPR